MAVPVTTCPHHPAPDHLRATTGSLQLSCHLSYIASWWHHPLSHPIPSQSFLTLAKYILFPTTRWPPFSTLTKPPVSEALTYFVLSSFFLCLFSSCFLFSCFCSATLTWLSLLAALLNPCRISACTCSTFRKDIQFHIFLLYSFILQDISRLCHLTLSICAPFHLVPLSGLLAPALTFIL